MPTVTIDLPDSLLAATGQSKDELAQEARFLLALKLFEVGKVSSGRAAEICGMSRVQFLLAAGDAGVSLLDLDEQELDRELEE
jgi:predicted HTH domain antitoxin